MFFSSGDPPQTTDNILSLLIVCVLDAVCRAFYKQSMVQREVRKLCVNPAALETEVGV